MNTGVSLLQTARTSFHAALIRSATLCLAPRKKPKKGFPDEHPSNADGDSLTSIAIARAIYDRIQSESTVGGRLAGQISGSKFELITRSFVEETFRALRSSLRQRNNPLPLLHASISCKWTLRSDRAQNARSEALNLIRNRKGRLPHIAVVTGEPLPSRLASLALGTGDLDCVYHFALPELIESVAELGNEDSANLVQIMVDGKRV